MSSTAGSLSSRRRSSSRRFWSEAIPLLRLRSYFQQRWVQAWWVCSSLILLLSLSFFPPFERVAGARGRLLDTDMLILLLPLIVVLRPRGRWVVVALAIVYLFGWVVQSPAWRAFVDSPNSLVPR